MTLEGQTSGRVVATGVGVISPIGAGISEFEKELYSGSGGIRPSARFGGASVAEVANFDAQKWLGKGIRVLDRGARLLCVATQMALHGTGLAPDPAGEGDPEIGLVCGTMFGSVHSIVAFDWSGVTEGPNYVNPMEFPNTVINSAAGQAAIRYRLRGLNSTLCAGLASGLHALHYAAECLRFGRAPALVAGGAEELCDETLLAFGKLGVASPSGWIEPFGANRDGAIPGEGSALFVLEREESARARAAEPWFEICGFGAEQDAYGIQSYSMRGEGAAKAIEQALASAEISADQVACVVSSANGSRSGDEMEARALRKVFGARLQRLPVYAPKGALGEALGASGAFGVMAAGLILRRQSAPPTVGFGGDGCGLRLSSEPQPIDGDYALVNAFSCDGNNAALVIRQWKN
jgi:3-oxoacyl-[acyl-carrier-protein] synthase II